MLVGGGNTAIDCVRTLVRLGCKNVNLLYRRTRKEMPANMVEIEAAEHEGINFKFLAAPSKVVGENGKATHIEFLTMELGEPDASGRRRPVPKKGSEQLLEADMIISAIGQGPDVKFAGGKKLENLKITRWKTIDNKPEILQSSIPYIFTGGDAATGASLVVEAIGGGRRAARSIHLYLTGQEVKAPEKILFKKHIPESVFKTVPGVVKSARAKMPELPPKERINSFVETDLVLQEDEALREANRCLSCCRVCYNKDVKAA